MMDLAGIEKRFWEEKFATQIPKDGDLIEVDADKGTVMLAK